MPNEFNIKNGFITSGNSNVYANLTVTGTLNISSGLTVNSLSATTISATTATIRRIIGGSGNTTSGIYNFIGGGTGHTMSSLSCNSAIVSGGKNTSCIPYSFIGSGSGNTVNGFYSFIGAGCGNYATGTGSFVGGGFKNNSGGNCTSVVGGSNNSAILDYASVVGGNLNIGCGVNSFIGNGYQNVTYNNNGFIGNGAYNCNTASQYNPNYNSVIVGGCYNVTASGYYQTGNNFIGAGVCNILTGSYSTISGGYKNNHGGGVYSFIGGGACNTFSSLYDGDNQSTSIVGGTSNTVYRGQNSVIAGGSLNRICGGFAGGTYVWGGFIGAGNCNTVTLGTLTQHNASSIVGGSNNCLAAQWGFIGGGGSNYITGTTSDFSTIVGGCRHTIACQFSFIGGGICNRITSQNSGILGGSGNTVSGNYSFAAGCGITASVNNTFYSNNFCSSSGTISATGTKGSVITSGSSTTAFLTFSGSNTVGGTGYTDFIRVVNTAAGATNATKTIRVNITGGIEFLNSTYLAQTLTLTDGGILYVGGGNIAVTSNNDPGTNYLSFNNNGTSIYDDGNTHIHSRSNGGSMWINTNNGAIILGNQSPVLGGGAASGIIMGSGSTTIRAFANIYGGKTYTIGGYGYLATIGAGTGGGTTATYGLYVQQRVEATEFDATSDERLKNIQGEIELDDAIKLVTNLKPIKYTWKDKDNEGIKAGYSAQQVVKSGFNHLIGHIKNEDLIETTDDEGFTSPEGFQLTMNYDQVIPYHGVVIKHLLEEIDNLKKEIEILKSK